MSGEKLHCFAGKRWSGDATSALNSAVAQGGIVLTEGDENVQERFRRNGIKDVRRLNMSGWFGALNLSRMIRISHPSEILVYSKSLLPKVEQALSLAKMYLRVEDMTDKICVPKVNFVDIGDKLIWIGYITENCGLRALLEALKEMPGRRLKVVGVGEAKVVSPLLKLAKTPQLAGRVEWVGEKEDVYREMIGCRAGVITSTNPREKVVFEEYANAGLPVICGTTAEELKSML